MHSVDASVPTQDPLVGVAAGVPNGATNGTNGANVESIDKISKTLDGVDLDNAVEEGELAAMGTGISSTYSASVVRGEVTYIFTSEIDPDQFHIVMVRKVYHNDYWGPRQTLRIGRIPAPRARGDMSASLFQLEDGSYGIRLYIIHKSSIIEYCLDTPVGKKDEWFRGAFASVDLKDAPVMLKDRSFLTTFGTDQLKNLGVTYEGKEALLRIFIVEKPTERRVTMLTHAGTAGKGKWYRNLIEN